MTLRIYDPNRPGKEWGRELRPDELVNHKVLPYDCTQLEPLEQPCEECGAVHVPTNDFVRDILAFAVRVVLGLLGGVLALVGAGTIAWWLFSAL